MKGLSIFQAQAGNQSGEIPYPDAKFSLRAQDLGVEFSIYEEVAQMARLNEALLEALRYPSQITLTDDDLYHEYLNPAGRETDITPLMRLVARPIDSDFIGKTINMLFAHLEREIIKLLDNGADINAVDSHGRSALMHVVIGEHYAKLTLQPGRERFTKLLLDKGADPTILDNDGKTALDYYQAYIEEQDHPAIELLKKAVKKSRKKTNKADGFFLPKYSGSISVSNKNKPTMR